MLSIKVTPGNIDDRKLDAFLCRKLFGRMYADKGYVARWLVDLLRARQMDFITKVRKNMKPVQRKRSINPRLVTDLYLLHSSVFII